MRKQCSATIVFLALGAQFTPLSAANDKSPYEMYLESPLYTKHNGIEDFVEERCERKDHSFFDSEGRQIVRRFIGINLDFIDKEIRVATRANTVGATAKFDTWPRFNFYMPVQDVSVLLSDDDSFVWGFRCSDNSGKCIRQKYNPETGRDQWSNIESVAFRCPKANEVVNAISDFMVDVPPDENPYAD